MKCDTNRLQSYLDEALAPEDRTIVAMHLTTCTGCQRTLTALRHQEQIVESRLSALDPQPAAIPDATQALAQFRERAQRAVAPSRWSRVKERILMSKETLPTQRWRMATVGLTALLVVAALFSFPAAREVAAQFLGVFRVRKFAVIPVDPSQLERLEDFESQLESGLLGEPTFLREPSEPQDVADAAEASALAGFEARVPTALPEGAALTRFTVATGPAMRLEVDRAALQTLLDVAGVQGVTLPPIDTITAEVDVQTMVEQVYRTSSAKITVGQLPSPTATLPAGVDPSELGEALLQLLGMPAEDAARVAQTIDWSSTVVIPLPANVSRFREVEVDGVTGLLVEEEREYRSQRLHRVLLWHKDDIVYSVQGQNVDASELLRVANSLH